MSSTERAPEPTMEEILASIRRIISDDEANSTQQRATSSEYAEQVRVEDADYEAADTQMIADIERALGSVQGAAEPAAWNRTARPYDLDDAKGILELLSRRLGLSAVSYVVELANGQRDTARIAFF